MTVRRRSIFDNFVVESERNTPQLRLIVGFDMSGKRSKAVEADNSQKRRG